MFCVMYIHEIEIHKSRKNGATIEKIGNGATLEYKEKEKLGIEI